MASNVGLQVHGLPSSPSEAELHDPTGCHDVVACSLTVCTKSIAPDDTLKCFANSALAKGRKKSRMDTIGIYTGLGGWNLQDLHLISLWLPRGLAAFKR